MTASSLIAGVDVGGTKILAAIVDETGKVLSTEYTLTEAEAGPAVGLRRIVEAIERAGSRAKVNVRNGLAGVGIAIAGLVDSPHGLLVTSPHLPGWTEVPIAREIEAALRTRIFVINDAKAAALGEQRFGAGQGVRDQIYMTVSTGIGGGIIIGGRLYTGYGGAAGEIGHMVIDVSGPRCDCGNNGCLESLASGSAIARDMKEKLASGASSLVSDMGVDPQDLDAQVVSAAAEQGDALAREVIHRAGTYLGVGLANLVNIFNPELIIVGGGAAKIGSRFLDPAVSEMKRRAFARPAAQVKIVRAQLGDNSGVLGAGAFVLQQTTDGPDKGG